MTRRYMLCSECAVACTYMHTHVNTYTLRAGLSGCLFLAISHTLPQVTPHTHAGTPTHTHTHARARAQIVSANTHTHTHIHPHKVTVSITRLSIACNIPRSAANIPTYASRTYTRTHSNIHTHTHTHKHMHSQSACQAVYCSQHPTLCSEHPHLHSLGESEQIL